MNEKRRLISYWTEFVRFSSGFASIIGLAMIALHFAVAAQ